MNTLQNSFNIVQDHSAHNNRACTVLSRSACEPRPRAVQCLAFLSSRKLHKPVFESSHHFALLAASDKRCTTAHSVSAALPPLNNGALDYLNQHTAFFFVSSTGCNALLVRYHSGASCHRTRYRYQAVLATGPIAHTNSAEEIHA